MWLRRGIAVIGWTLLLLVWPAASSWAAYPPPAPPPTATDRGYVASQWKCNETPAGVGGTPPAFEECSVTAWATMAPWPVFTPGTLVTLPTPLPIVAAAPLAVTVPTPVPVVEQSPTPDSVALSCGGAEPPATDCLVTAELVEYQWIALGLFLGALLVLALTTFLRRESRGLR